MCFETADKFVRCDSYVGHTCTKIYFSIVLKWILSWNQAKKNRSPSAHMTFFMFNKFHVYQRNGSVVISHINVLAELTRNIF
jgi:hypothetical protein